MCFNEQVSIITYVIGLLGCINLYVNYDKKVEAIFFGWVVQMQLIEYFLWKNQSCNQKNINTTKTGIIINHTEPIVLWISILVLSKNVLPDYVNLLMLVFTIITYIYTKDVFVDKCTKKEGKHLVWEWNISKNSEIYYTFFLICLNLLCIYGLDDGKKYALALTITLLISFALYRNEKSVGAMWCFFAAFIPWITPHV